MQSITNQFTTIPTDSKACDFSPLELITRPTVPTADAAHYLNRRPQTLRAWACLENGPLRPVRICGRLAWKVSEIRALLDCDLCK